MRVHPVETSRPVGSTNVTGVDYLSLDIQGPGLKVLKGVPFDLVSIKVKLNSYINSYVTVDVIYELEVRIHTA